MRFILAGSLSAVVSWVFNKATLSISDTKAIIYLVPFTEEVTKSSLAIIIGAPLVLSHLFFGMIEAVFDQFNNKNGFLAGMVSILGHTLFGYITYIVFVYKESYLFGIFAGYLLHMLWNLFVMEIIVARKRRKGL